MPRHRLPSSLNSLITEQRDFETKGFEIGGSPCIGLRFKLGAAQLLVVKARKGYVGCSYIDLQKAEVLGDAAATLSGISSFDELLSGKVEQLTKRAAELGVRKGMGGREALELLNR